jgi:hypothetical protein
MARRSRVWHSVQASKAEALVAVDFYNSSGQTRSFDGFVVHMHLAWLYLLHAEFARDQIDYRYWDSAHRRLVRVDGEPKTWELAQCVKRRWPSDTDPVRANLDFFIGLRNKIEHRYEEGVALSVAGHSQALLMNYEAELVDQFGIVEGLADRLRFPVFLSSLTDDGVTALKKLRGSIPARASRYIRDFHDRLGDDVVGDNRFEFSLYLIPHVGPKSQADLAVTFVEEKDLTRDELDALAALGQAGVIATRTKKVPVQNIGRFLPAAVVAKVKSAVPQFSMSDHVWMWRHFRVRPAAGAPDPTRTDSRYCIYDEPVKTYLYTDAWVKKVIREARAMYQAPSTES